MINFSNDGWHGVISDNITFENVAIVAQATADYINEKNDNDKAQTTVVVGYDTRFLSREYSDTIQRVLTGNRINVFLHKKPVPTSLLSCSAKLLNADLGIMVTGETRPARYSGIIFREKSGIPVDGCFMNELFNHLYRRYPRQDNGRQFLEYIDLSEKYINLIKEALSLTDGCFKNRLIIYDSFYGSVGSLPEQCFKSTGAGCVGIRTRPNPCFQDCVPKPNKRNIQPLSKLVCQRQGDAGFFFGGDGSQFAVVDREGRYLDEPLVSALILMEWTKLFGSDFPLYLCMDTPYMAGVLAESMKIKTLPYGWSGADKYNDRGIIWEYNGLRFTSAMPDRDALLQSMLLLSALKRCNFNYKKLMEEINIIMGIRYYNQKTLSVEQKNWIKARENLLMLKGGFFKDFNCIGIEEDMETALKLNFQEGGFVLFHYREQENSLQITIDFPGTDGIEGVFEKLAIDLEV